MQQLQDYVAAELQASPARGSGEKVDWFIRERWAPGANCAHDEVNETLLRIAAAVVFRQHGPIKTELPVSQGHCAALIEFGTPLGKAVGLYGRSLAAHRYDVTQHPFFPAYAAALFESPSIDPAIKSDIDIFTFASRSIGKTPALNSKFIWVSGQNK